MMLPPQPPVKAGWKGREGESWGAETTGERGRETGRAGGAIGERGKGSVMPTLGERVEGTAVVSISRLQLTQSPGPSHTVSTQHFCWGWVPSPYCPCCHTVSCCLLPHLPSCPTGHKKGTGSSCLAQQPPQPHELQQLLGG